MNRNCLSTGVLLLLIGTRLAQASAIYSVLERQPPSGGTEVESICSVANDGAAVGRAITITSDGRYHYDDHAYWTSVNHGSALETLGYSGDLDGTTAWAINNVGEACGTGWTDIFTGFSRALFWAKHTQAPVALKPLGKAHSADGYAACRALNDAGILVGTSTDASGIYRATKWIGEDAIALSPTGPTRTASAISPAGLIAGRLAGHAALWSDGSVTDLGTLGGDDSDANRVNDAGQVVGQSATPQTTEQGYRLRHTFLWQAGAMTDLGVLPGGRYSDGLGINRWGDIVGNSDLGGSSDLSHAVLWLKGSPIDLNQMLKGKVPRDIVLESAVAIADNGRFEVSGSNRSAYKHLSYLVVPHYSTNMTLTSSEDPSLSGDTVTFRVRVRTDDAHGIPTGSILFRDGSTTLASVKLDSNGNVRCSTSTLSLGAHTIYALYSENDVYDGNLATLKQRVLFEPIPIPQPPLARPPQSH